MTKKRKLQSLLILLVVLFLFLFNLSISELESNNAVSSSQWILRSIGAIGNFIIFYLMFESDRIIVCKIQKWKPWGTSDLLRIGTEVVASLLFSTLVLTLFSLLSLLLRDFADQPPTITELKVAYLENLLLLSCINCCFIALLEGKYFFQEWKHSLVMANRLECQTQKLEKENIQLKFEVLKGQLDPHFLFNNLSVLSSLCYPDPAPMKAKQFIENFSNIYRHILNVQEELLIPLERELSFLDSYIFLLKMRFGDGILFRINIDKEVHQLCIPPLTLQLLVENAMKHNQVNEKFPLEISISNRNHTLIVKNNLRPKAFPAASNGYGFRRLEEFYSMLSQEKPSSQKLLEEYLVELPLIADN